MAENNVPILPLGAAATLLLAAFRLDARRKRKPLEICMEAGRGAISADGLEAALGWKANVTQLVFTPTNDPDRERVKIGLSSRQPTEVMQRLARMEGVTGVRRTG